MSLRQYINRKLLYILPFAIIGVVTLTLASCGSPDQTGDAGVPTEETQPGQNQ